MLSVKGWLRIVCRKITAMNQYATNISECSPRALVIGRLKNEQIKIYKSAVDMEPVVICSGPFEMVQDPDSTRRIFLSLSPNTETKRELRDWIRLLEEEVERETGLEVRSCIRNRNILVYRSNRIDVRDDRGNSAPLGNGTVRVCLLLRGFLLRYGKMWPIFSLRQVQRVYWTLPFMLSPTLATIADQVEGDVRGQEGEENGAPSRTARVQIELPRTPIAPPITIAGDTDTGTAIGKVGITPGILAGALKGLRRRD
jgi:hypothetical protein